MKCIFFSVLQWAKKLLDDLSCLEWLSEKTAKKLVRWAWQQTSLWCVWRCEQRLECSGHRDLMSLHTADDLGVRSTEHFKILCGQRSLRDGFISNTNCNMFWWIRSYYWILTSYNCSALYWTTCCLEKWQMYMFSKAMDSKQTVLCRNGN